VCVQPLEEGCLSCCEPDIPPPTAGQQADPGPWVELKWTGNCTGCVPGAPCEKGNCPCGNCFPGVLPWWNEIEEHPNGPPAGCKPCSRCKERDLTDFREIEFGTCPPGDVGDPLCQPDGSCDCSKAQPPNEGDCPAPAPGVFSCTCWCDYAQKIRDWCQLDPTPTVFQGPCAYDRMVAQSKNEEFTYECDDQGYYKLVQCGPKAPPPLAPSPPQALGVTNSAETTTAESGEMCWCSEPSASSSTSPAMRLNL
jgi:hypothetical protein